ncbi:MAG: hypothetical protein ACUVWS_17840, partial [Roseiflexus sp.]
MLRRLLTRLTFRAPGLYNGEAWFQQRAMLTTITALLVVALAIAGAPPAQAVYTSPASGSVTMPPGSQGAATPNPSTIEVSGVSGSIVSVVVRLNGLSHTFPDDLDIVLVGPSGQAVMLMSDVGG